MSDTVGEYLQAESIKPYIRDAYDVKVLCSSSLSVNESVCARLHNNLVNALEENPLLPKAMVFVLDGDIVKTVHHSKKIGISEIFTEILRDLLSGIHKMILGLKEKLPNKSKRDVFPTILWAQLPLHVNFPDTWNMQRRVFNKCLENTVQLFSDMATLKLLKVWDSEDRALFNERKFTATGLEAYWSSVDSAFRHWDTFIFVKAKVRSSRRAGNDENVVNSYDPSTKSREKIRRDVQRFRKFKSSGKFHWQKKENKKTSREENSRLPKPPMEEDSDDY